MQELLPKNRYLPLFLAQGTPLAALRDCGTLFDSLYSTILYRTVRNHM